MFTGGSLWRPMARSSVSLLRRESRHGCHNLFFAAASSRSPSVPTCSLQQHQQRESLRMTTLRAFHHWSKNGGWDYSKETSASSLLNNNNNNTATSSKQCLFSTKADTITRNDNNNNGADEQKISSKADIMRRLGISNAELRASSARPNGSINKRRRRHKLPHNNKNNQPDPRPAALYPVRAMHIAQTIDIDKVMQKVLCQNTEKRKLFGKNSLVVELETPESSSDSPDLSPEPPQFVSVFRFGSVVFLNVPDKQAASLTQRIRELSTDTVEPGTERREHFGIMVQPHDHHDNHNDIHTSNFADSSAAMTVSDPPPEQIVTGDYCIVREIDLNGVAVITNILAQTVALDSYNDTVDRLLSEFAAINSNVRGSGHFKHSHKNFLFKTVAQNNAIFIDMISKIRLKDRSETAWTMTRYETIHYGLKAEFEIDDRFDQIEFKLNLIQQNAKFFLEVMQHQKSNSLEWIIVVLIGVECVIMCIDMAGMGEPFFKFLGVI